MQCSKATNTVACFVTDSDFLYVVEHLFLLERLIRDTFFGETIFDRRTIVAYFWGSVKRRVHCDS